MNTKKALLLLSILLLVSTSLFAQTNAQLNGTVTSDGAPLPGATVTISSPALQGTRTAVSNENGQYYFGGLPPGRYSVRVELEGMQPVNRTVELGVAQTGRADASLKVAAIADVITVTASAPAVLETSQVTTNLEGTLIEELPVARTVLGAALLAPGVNNNTASAGQLSISGSPGYDNLVMVNGVVITESVRSQALQLYIEDAIQETTVLTGAVSAEYGRFTGGVVNSITKSGGNEFSGSLRDSMTNPDWTNKTPWATQVDPIDKLNEIYEGTLGGFILRDRLWFFAAGRQAETSLEQYTRPLPAAGDPSRKTFYSLSETSNEKMELKLTGQITDKHSLVGSYYDETSETTNNRFTASSYDNDSLAERKDPKSLMSAFYNGILTSNFLVEARYSEMEYGIGHGNGSKYTDFVRGTIVRNVADSYARFNSPTFCGVCDKEWRNNDSWIAKGSYFLGTPSFGSHTIVGGMESFSEMRYANNYQSGSNFRFFVQGVQRINGGETLYSTILPGQAYFAWTPIFSSAAYTDLQTDSVFVNDKWDLTDKWSFNVGFRYDANDAVDADGNQVSDDDRISPRLTAMYDVNGDGRLRLSASYNEYVSRIVEGPGTAGSAGGSPAYIEFGYNGPAINSPGTPAGQLIDTRSALAIVWEWFQSQGGTSNLALLLPGGFRDVPGYSAMIADTLASPYVREMTLGFGLQLGTNAFLKVDGISRDWKDFYAYRVDQTTPIVTDFLNIKHDVQVVENTNDIKREYRGIQFQSGWRPNRFNVGVNYTYSTLKGNDDQESATSGTVGNSPGGMFYSELLNYDTRQPEGYLSQDQRHRARVWVGYDVPMPSVLGRVNLSALHNFDSGTPYSAAGTIYVSGAGTGAPTGLPYVGAPSTGNYYFSERGEYRLPDVQRTDLALNYSLPIWKIEFFAQAEVLNVLDNDDLVGVNTTVNSARQSSNFVRFNPFSPGTLIECPQGTSGANCKAMGAHWQKGSSFGMANGVSSYQLPMTYQGSVGIRF